MGFVHAHVLQKADRNRVLYGTRVTLNRYDRMTDNYQGYDASTNDVWVNDVQLV